MSAVTLNLRIASAGQPKLCNKNSKLKFAEVLPQIPDNLRGLLDEAEVDAVVNAEFLEHQIVGIRKVSVFKWLLLALVKLTTSGLASPSFDVKD